MNIFTSTMLDIARSHVGVREIGGNNRGPQIEAWLRRVGQPPGKAYCMAFVWCCIDDTCTKLRITNVLRPRAGVVRTWGQLPPACYIDSPVPGCLGFHHDIANPGLGHVVIVDALPKDPSTGVFTIEGNTSPEGGREALRGGGVWRHTPANRPLSYFNLGWADVSVLFASQLALARP